MTSAQIESILKSFKSAYLEGRLTKFQYDRGSESLEIFSSMKSEPQMYFFIEYSSSRSLKIGVTLTLLETNVLEELVHPEDASNYSLRISEDLAVVSGLQRDRVFRIIPMRF